MLYIKRKEKDVINHRTYSTAEKLTSYDVKDVC